MYDILFVSGVILTLSAVGALFLLIAAVLAGDAGPVSALILLCLIAAASLSGYLCYRAGRRLDAVGKQKLQEMVGGFSCSIGTVEVLSFNSGTGHGTVRVKNSPLKVEVLFENGLGGGLFFRGVDVRGPRRIRLTSEFLEELNRCLTPLVEAKLF